MSDDKRLPLLTLIEVKAALLLALLVALVLGSAIYLMYARGVFEDRQTLVLVANDSEGVTVGMDLTFSGFPIGRVRRIELAEDGNVHIVFDLPKRDARWLRTSSVFTMERSLVGATRIRAYSGMLEDPPLPDGAQRPVLQGDAMAEIPQLVASVRDLLNNLNGLTAGGSPLALTLAQLQRTSEKLNGPQGALGVLTGNEADRAKIIASIDRTHALLARLEAVAARTESLVGNADRRVFGDEGLATDAQAVLRQVNTALAEARESLRKVDAVLVDAQAISGNVRGASTDLGALRADVEASLRKVESLVNDINRRWPFARETEVKLP